MPRTRHNTGELSEPVVGRLSVYRRMLRELLEEGHCRVCSHDLAVPVGSTAAQVRRDLMTIGGVQGRTRCGYEALPLVERIGEVLSHGRSQHRVVVIGIGNLGRAIITHFAGSSMVMLAAFDINDDKIGQSVAGCPCYHVDELPRIAVRLDVDLAIVTVPHTAAQDVTDLVVASGIKGLLNFAPVTLQVPESVFVERLDIAVALDKVGYFADCRRHAATHAVQKKEAEAETVGDHGKPTRGLSEAQSINNEEHE